MAANLHPSRRKLIEATFALIRAKGHAAATVDDICAAAGVTKGSFFHHFASKEALVLAAIEHWNGWTGELFAAAPYHRPEDPRDRVLGYIDFRAEILQGEVGEFTCLLGTLVQETYASHPAIRAACEAGMVGHAGTLVSDIEAAKARHAPEADWSAESLALFIQAVLQGSFVFAKATQEPHVARGNLAHLRRYVAGLFRLTASKEN